MVKALIVCCENIRDKQCIGCQRCLTAARERLGNFEKFDKVDVVGILGCGGCPGAVIPRLKLYKKWIEGFDDFDVVFIGNCIKASTNFGGCPLNLEKLVEDIKNVTGKDVIVGTHPW
jgi:predicted metal-binding protein